MSTLRLQFLKIRLLIFTYISKAAAKLFFVTFPPLVAVCAFIENESGEILVLDHSYAKGFGLPGGRVDPDETLEAATKREVLEETGLEVTKIEYLFSTEGRQYGLSAILACYKVTVSGDMSASAEGSLHFMQPADLSGKMLYPNAEVAVKKYATMQS